MPWVTCEFVLSCLLRHGCRERCSEAGGQDKPPQGLGRHPGAPLAITLPSR
jgi:hypothetical protein